MLFVFHLSWPDYDISAQISRANQNLAQIAKAEGLDAQLQFNCASLGAGELRTGTPGARKDDQPIETLKMDSIRRFHRRELGVLEQDGSYRAYKELAVALKTLKGNGHHISAIGLYPRRSMEAMLEDGHIRDYFEDAVYGIETVEKWAPEESSLSRVYIAAIRDDHSPTDESVVVSDTVEGVKVGKLISPRSVIGYVPSSVAYQQNGPSIRKLEKAGADLTVSTEADLSSLPWLLTGKAQSTGHHSVMTMAYTLNPK